MPSSSLNFLVAALVAGGRLANAHMTMKTPVPYDASQGVPSTSPLVADGSDWPCKMGDSNYDVTKIATMNNIKAGDPQTLSFIGTATHGGGSCQLSLTMDKTITKKTQFKVFHSIEGGCPADTAGNLSPGQSAATFNWSLPTDMPNGQYSLAWTWFNKVGNREMYMNCAPITVTGGSDSQDGFNKLPDMFVANIKGAVNGKYNGGEWATKETVDTEFPEPGPSVDKEPGDKNLGPPVQSGGSSAATSGGSSGATQNEASPASSGSSSSGSSGDTSSGSSGSSSSNSGSGAAAPQANVASPAAPASGASSPAASPGASSSSASGGTGTCPTGSSPCSSPGTLVCIGPAQFGICDTNNCAVAQPVAAGTSCSNGGITKRSLPVGRYFRHGKAHQHRAGYYAGLV